MCTELQRRGLESYLPIFRELHRWKDRKTLVQVPVFPGYVFGRLRITPESRLNVLTTTGVVNILGGGDGPIPICDSEIDSVRRLVESGNSAPFPFLQQGTKVRVQRGPLKGAVGLFVRMKSSGRLVVSIELLAQSIAAEVAASDVERVRPVACLRSA